MLSALLLAGLFAAPLATAALFVPGTTRTGRREELWRQIGRLTLALLSTAALIIVVLGLMALVGVTQRNLVAVGAGLAFASLFWLPFTRRWGARAHLCWTATTYTFVVYLVFMVWWTFSSHLGVGGTAGGMLLWLLEVLAATLGCAYLWELCDTLGRASWVRRVDEQELRSLPEGYRPFVSLQVPCYNEPPDMVIETLKSLRSIDYPNYEIVVLDDNTDDEALWRPVQEWCSDNGAKFVHLENWPGYKSGALNYALEHLIDPSCELIGVIDSDYQIEPDFLRRCAPLFEDQRIGFIQAPQDYRDWRGAKFYRRLYYSYRYFFAVSQPSRNERDGAIFAGTMGLIRRQALEQAGGWDEWCITEDAELSLRLLRGGWSGSHVDHSFGKGIMPLTFEALKGQRFRWCFGGIQILRRHWRSMLPGAKSADNQMSLGQRWAYLSGAVQWYGDLLALLFFIFLLVGAGNIAFGGGLLFRKLTGFLLGAIPLLVLLGLLRAIALLRRGTGASWRDAIGAFLIWQSTSLTVARASVQALFAKQAAFLRTPKTHGDESIFDSLRANLGETFLGLLGLAGIVAALTRHSGYGGVLIAGLLAWPVVSFLAAPVNSVSAQRAALPPELQARRSSEQLRYGPRRVTYALGGLGFAGVLGAVALALFVPGASNVVPPQVLGPATGHPAHYGPVTSPGRSGPTDSPSTTATTSKGTQGSTTTSTSIGGGTTGTSPTTTPTTSASTTTSSSSTTSTSTTNTTTTSTSTTSPNSDTSTTSTTSATSSNRATAT